MKQISTTRQTLKLYWQSARKYKRSLAALVVFMPILQAVEDFGAPLVISGMLNQLSKYPDTPLSAFYPQIALITALELIVYVGWRPYIKVLWKFEESVMSDMYNSCFEHLMNMSYRFYSNRFAGSIVSQVNKFVGSFERFTDTITWGFYKLLIAVVLTVIILLPQIPLFSLVLSVASLTFVLVIFYIKRSELAGNAAWAAAETRRTGQLADTVGNIAAVKAFGHEDLEASLMSAQVANTKGHSLGVMKRVLGNEYYSVPIHRIINLSAIMISLYLVTKGVIGVGVIYLALTYTLGILRRLWDLNNGFRTLNRVFGDAYDMTEILQIEPEIKDPAKAKAINFKDSGISFENISFKYKEEDSEQEYLFDNLRLEIKPGEKVGLVGPSGGGKTTITKLLLRFMDIQSGNIKIGGQNIAEIKQRELRKHIGYVPQEPLMFHRSLADNIRYGRLEASDKEVINAAKVAHSDEFIKKLPKGYQTLVGERGTKLSGGQRQRVAIARTLLKNAPILVLDEATSALDSESEVLIQDALWKLMEGRTAIVIAHRLSTIQKMDRIIVLDKGKIVEQGTHKELVKKNGTYAGLWAHQSGGFLED